MENTIDETSSKLAAKMDTITRPNLIAWVWKNKMINSPFVLSSAQEIVDKYDIRLISGSTRIFVYNMRGDRTEALNSIIDADSKKIIIPIDDKTQHIIPDDDRHVVAAIRCENSNDAKEIDEWLRMKCLFPIETVYIDESDGYVDVYTDSTFSHKLATIIDSECEKHTGFYYSDGIFRPSPYIPSLAIITVGIHHSRSDLVADKSSQKPEKISDVPMTYILIGLCDKKLFESDNNRLNVLADSIVELFDGKITKGLDKVYIYVDKTLRLQVIEYLAENDVEKEFILVEDNHIYEIPTNLCYLVASLYWRADRVDYIYRTLYQRCPFPFILCAFPSIRVINVYTEEPFVNELAKIIDKYGGVMLFFYKDGVPRPPPLDNTKNIGVLPINVNSDDGKHSAEIVPQSKSNSHEQLPQEYYADEKTIIRDTIKSDLGEMGIKPIISDKSAAIYDVRCIWCFYLDAESSVKRCEHIAFCKACLTKYTECPLRDICPMCIYTNSECYDAVFELWDRNNTTDKTQSTSEIELDNSDYFDNNDDYDDSNDILYNEYED